MDLYFSLENNQLIQRGKIEMNVQKENFSKIILVFVKVRLYLHNHINFRRLNLGSLPYIINAETLLYGDNKLSSLDN